MRGPDYKYRWYISKITAIFKESNSFFDEEYSAFIKRIDGWWTWHRFSVTYIKFMSSPLNSLGVRRLKNECKFEYYQMRLHQRNYFDKLVSFLEKSDWFPIFRSSKKLYVRILSRSLRKLILGFENIISKADILTL